VGLVLVALMSESLLSPSWYRVAELRPRLRSQGHFYRHRYRGELWYVLQDSTGSRSHLLTPAAHRLAGLMNGQRTTQEIWEAVCTEFGDDAPTQDETIRLLGMLHFADLLHSDVSPDTAELFRRAGRERRGASWRRFANPLSVRIPLVDPDAWLDRALPWVRFLGSLWVLCLAGLAVLAAAVLAVLHRAELGAGAAEALLRPDNLVLLVFLYPLVKGLHELGHAFTAKAFGGEVHEMGVLFLVGMPMPYVDASSTAVFPEKSRRMAVGAAGIAVEGVLAALALFVWLEVEPGLLRRIAYDVMWIGGVSTLLFNGNPLLRFDGYYVFSDWVEIPNLGTRASRSLAHLTLTRIFRVESSSDPARSAGERAWLVSYGVLSTLYRILILFGIAVFIADRLPGVGILLAGVVAFTQLALPLARKLAFLVQDPRLEGRRARALSLSAGAGILVAFLMLAVPLPSHTRADGVVRAPEGSEVRAGADGFVERVLVEPGARVEPGTPLILTHEPFLQAQVAIDRARLQELRARYHAERVSDRVKAQIIEEEIATATAELARARERMGEVVVRSPARGTFVVPEATDLVGRFLSQGALVGWVVGPRLDTVRVAVDQSNFARIRQQTQGVELRLASRPGHVLATSIRRQVPGASDRLPSPALGATGGGRLAVDPADADGVRTLEPVFQLDLTLPVGAGPGRIGERVHVRFDHGSETAATQAWRALRGLFLRRLGV